MCVTVGYWLVLSAIVHLLKVSDGHISPHGKGLCALTFQKWALLLLCSSTHPAGFMSNFNMLSTQGSCCAPLMNSSRLIWPVEQKSNCRMKFIYNKILPLSIVTLKVHSLHFKYDLTKCVPSPSLSTACNIRSTTSSTVSCESFVSVFVPFFIR